jgi:enterobactin synthetase component D
MAPSGPAMSLLQEERLTRLLQAARPGLCPIGYGVATAGDYRQVALYPEEERSTRAMSQYRKREFWMGRAAGRRALQDMGMEPHPIAMAGRRPVFASGLTGSISHSDGAAVAMVAASTRFRSVGIDLQLRPLPARAAALVLSSTELQMFTGGECSCTTLFSAKEAAFKALDALVEGGVAPLRRILLEQVAGGFTARLAQFPCLEASVATRRIANGALAWAAIA